MFVTFVVKSDFAKIHYYTFYPFVSRIFGCAKIIIQSATKQSFCNKNRLLLHLYIIISIYYTKCKRNLQVIAALFYKNLFTIYFKVTVKNAV